MKLYEYVADLGQGEPWATVRIRADDVSMDGGILSFWKNRPGDKYWRDLIVAVAPGYWCKVVVVSETPPR